MSKKITIIIAGMALSVLAYGQNEDTNSVFGSLSELPALENTTTSKGDRQSSPSQVVILNNTPNSQQTQNQESAMDQKQKAGIRQGWGTGASLEALRGARMDKEAKNEQTLMEKLEESRMEDEKRRLKKLFKIKKYNQSRYEELGDEFEMEVEHHHPQAPVKPVVVVADPAPVVQAPVVAAPTIIERPSYRSLSKPLYVKGQLGLGGYKAAENAVGVASWGISVGKDISPKLSFELGLFKTTYEVDDPLVNSVNSNYASVSRMRNLNQYNLTGLVGYKVIQTSGVAGLLRAGLSYVRRDSESADYDEFQRVRSNTIDGLIGIGAELELAENISVTGSFDYYTNIISNISSTEIDMIERVENSDYFVLGAGLKLNF